MYNRQYELMPIDGRKSFYGKAWVDISKRGTETLYSYGTPIVKRIAKTGRLFVSILLAISSANFAPPSQI